MFKLMNGSVRRSAAGEEWRNSPLITNFFDEDVSAPSLITGFKEDKGHKAKVGGAEVGAGTKIEKGM